jgi:bifunctional non-homologous end joining protein LigD
MMPEPKSVHLFFREGSSDKVYNVHLTECAGGWDVRFQNGRRGKALRDGVKIEGADFDSALKIFEKTVASKIKGGYTEQESGVAFSSAELAGEVTGFRPQLLNEINEEEALGLGPDWLVQEKHDGERRGAIFEGGVATYANRRGLAVGVQASVDAAFRRLGEVVGPLTIDAEDMGDHLVIFDVTQHFMIGPDAPFKERAAVLKHLEKTILDSGLGEALRVDAPIPLPVFSAMGADLSLRKGGAEGYVLRHADSVYTPGRPNSGGEALKVKFWAEATCRVTKGREGKASIGLELQDGTCGPWVPVGNVTVPSNQEKPEIGALVEVRYLYAEPGGSLFQPLLKGIRTDVTEEAAQMVQLKYKGQGEPAVEGPDGP